MEYTGGLHFRKRGKVLHAVLHVELYTLRHNVTNITIYAFYDVTIHYAYYKVTVVAYYNDYYNVVIYNVNYIWLLGRYYTRRYNVTND